MARLTTVEIVPSTRNLTGRWANDAALDAFLGASRSVCECLGQAIRDASVPNRRSVARFYVVKAETGLARVDVAKSHDSDVDEGNIYVPIKFDSYSAEERLSGAWDIVFAAVTAVAVREKWPREVLEAIREAVVGRGLRYAQWGQWRVSPDRRHEACGFYFLDDDGLGHAQLIVRTRKTKEILHRSPAADALMTRQGFLNSAKTVRWESPRTVALVPWVDLAGRGSGRLDADLDSPSVAADLTPPPVAACEPLPVVMRFVSPRALIHMSESAKQDAAHWLHAGGYGLLRHGADDRVIELWEQIILDARHQMDGHAWLASSPFINLHVQLLAGEDETDLGGTERVETAVGTELLTSLVIDTKRLDTLTDAALRQELIEHLARHLRAVATRRRLPELLPLTATAERGRWQAAAPNS